MNGFFYLFPNFVRSIVVSYLATYIDGLKLFLLAESHHQQN
jgi:hypothetical protein